VKEFFLMPLAGKLPFIPLKNKRRIKGCLTDAGVVRAARQIDHTLSPAFRRHQSN